METQNVFLKERIKNLGSAIFFNQSQAVLKLPNSIVRIIHVDDYGYLWFYMQRPQQHLNEFEKEFPVKLDFYRKGLDYTLQVTGKGCIVNDPEEFNLVTMHMEEVNKAVQNIEPEKLVLLKVKMSKADYWESLSGQKTSWLQNAIVTLQSWIFPHAPGYGQTTYYPSMSEVS